MFFWTTERGRMLTCCLELPFVPSHALRRLRRFHFLLHTWAAENHRYTPGSR
jgi:hypothetical protein